MNDLQLVLTALDKKWTFEHPTKGTFGVYDLFRLNLTEVNELAVHLYNQQTNSSISFIPNANKTEKDCQELELVKLIINFRYEKAQKAKQDAEFKAYQQKLMELRERKKDEGLNMLSLEELDKLLGISDGNIVNPIMEK